MVLCDDLSFSVIGFVVGEVPLCVLNCFVVDSWEAFSARVVVVGFVVVSPRQPWEERVPILLLLRLASVPILLGHYLRPHVVLTVGVVIVHL